MVAATRCGSFHSSVLPSGPSRLNGFGTSPIGINVRLFAQRYDALVATTVSAIVLSNAVSLVSLSVIPFLLA